MGHSSPHIQDKSRQLFRVPGIRYDQFLRRLRGGGSQRREDLESLDEELTPMWDPHVMVSVKSGIL